MPIFELLECCLSRVSSRSDLPFANLLCFLALVVASADWPEAPEPDVPEPEAPELNAPELAESATEPAPRNLIALTGNIA